MAARNATPKQDPKESAPGTPLGKGKKYLLLAEGPAFPSHFKAALPWKPEEHKTDHGGSLYVVHLGVTEVCSRSTPSQRQRPNLVKQTGKVLENITKCLVK